MNGRFEHSAVAIFIAMVLDGLDGRVARLTNTQSAFGAEYDSLSDMVAFGVAPALLAFEWALGSLGKVGWMVAFIYVAGAARSEEHTSELQSLMRISYAVFCLKKKKTDQQQTDTTK